MALNLGAGIAVENQPGAALMLAAQNVARSTPDGHTLVIVSSPVMAVNPTLYKKINYDPDKDFVPISWMDAGHLPTIVNAKLPIKDLADLDKFARANKTSLGTYGAGSYSHVAVEALNRHFKLQMEAVHYRGEAPMLLDLIAGRLSFGSPSVSLAAGRNLRVLAVFADTRHATFPEAPTFKELNLPSRISDDWLTLNMFAQGRELLAAGCGWLPLSWYAENDFHAALRQATRIAGEHLASYGHPLGYAGLRQQLAKDLAHRMGPLSADQIVLTHGVTHALELIIMGLLRPGDAVLVEEPGVARGEADAPDIDGRVYLPITVPVGSFAEVKITGFEDYDLLALPAGQAPATRKVAKQAQ